ncbi:MAG: hypothetical protein WCC22_06430 [Terriglobales bacterium]
MHSLKLASLALLILTTAAAGQGFKLYPGATKYTPPDTEETREAAKALPPGTTSTIYTTNDSFEKVVAFYKSLGKEYKMPGMRAGRKLPSGQDLKEMYLIFDGAADIVASKSWAKVQRPFIGDVDFKGGVPVYKDVRDITTIIVAEKK